MVTYLFFCGLLGLLVVEAGHPVTSIRFWTITLTANAMVISHHFA